MPWEFQSNDGKNYGFQSKNVKSKETILIATRYGNVMAQGDQ